MILFNVNTTDKQNEILTKFLRLCDILAFHIGGQIHHLPVLRENMAIDCLNAVFTEVIVTYKRFSGSSTSKDE